MSSLRKIGDIALKTVSAVQDVLDSKHGDPVMEQPILGQSQQPILGQSQQPDINAPGPVKQEIVLCTRWLKKSEVYELDHWTSPSQNGRGLLKLNGKEKIDVALPTLNNFEMILLDISNSDNLQWLQYNVNYITEKPELYNVTLISGKWQTEMAFHEMLQPTYRLRKVPVRCTDKVTFYHMLHSTYINQVKKGCFHALKQMVGFFLGRSS
jgi:hypothetical protein